jgi:hypothetical protein
MSTLAFIGYAMSVMLNAVLIATLIKSKRTHKHVHEWTPWSEWRKLRSTYSFRQVYFQRVRYCTECAQENKQIVGEHECDTRDRYNTLSCAHQEVYTAIFDPLYELRQINKDLEELQ